MGPYLSERQWGTVREEYSPDGSAWEYFPHEHAHRRAYRWGEESLAGICDAGQRLCLALALWNGKDPILKERLFGLSNADGNHGEWEYPWYAAWDLAFHCIPFALIDAEFAKAQLILLTREWYMHPKGLDY
jgi:hypothetical protein